jgi:hypothetical protein
MADVEAGMVIWSRHVPPWKHSISDLVRGFAYRLPVLRPVDVGNSTELRGSQGCIGSLDCACRCRCVDVDVDVDVLEA